jgi:chromatin segregation and condensation protein Rec8/ScpA/Scc1 (kleisin family)
MALPGDQQPSHRESLDQLPVSNAVVKKRVIRRRVGSIMVDETTELEQSQIQALVNDPSSLLRADFTWKSLQLFSICPIQVKTERRATSNAEEEQVPLNEDYYDYDDLMADPANCNEIVAKSPKNPRLSEVPQLVTENVAIKNEILLFWQEALHGGKARTLSQILDGNSRKTVAESFLQVLLLKSKGLLLVQQDRPYADILVTPTKDLFTCQETIHI